MIKNYFLLLLMLSYFPSRAQKEEVDNRYHFTIDLVHPHQNRVQVVLKTPRIAKENIIFQFPKVIPGMYAVDDFGRYIENLKAFNAKGQSLPVKRLDENSWTIHHANQLSRIVYDVSGSFADTVTNEVVFEPGGSDIEPGKVFVINNHCFLGYFENMKNIPFEISILHVPGIYGSTALRDQDSSAVRDFFMAESYNRIVDNPFMYNKPDTTTIDVGETQVLISVYSPRKKLSAAFLAGKLDTLLRAQTKYLGGKLPVNRYAFMVYLDDKPGVSGLQGALEHSYCSFYYFSETDSNSLAHLFVSAAAHEFFHIITPLSVHSEEIQYFNFQHPKMSEHLWLYEGTTEYHARMVQEKYGLITAEQLLQTFSDMITISKTRYNDTLALTTVSKGVLDKYQNQFPNFYLKGALAAMCLDIKLLELSDGKYGLMNLIQALSARYGKNKPFKDEELFNTIGSLSNPEIKDFLKYYVAGNYSLPLANIFDLVGVLYQPVAETKDSTYSLGSVSFSYNPKTSRLYVKDTTGMNEVGVKLGYLIKDELVSINGMEINTGNMKEVLAHFGDGSESGSPLTIQVVRKINGMDSLIVLKAEMVKIPGVKKNALSFLPNPSARQSALRMAWLSPNGIQIKP
jgi:predicted metalloprotease with PDZ domain